MFRRGNRGRTYDLHIGTSLIAVGIFCTLLTCLMTGAIAAIALELIILSWMPLDWIRPSHGVLIYCGVARVLGIEEGFLE